MQQSPQRLFSPTSDSPSQPRDTLRRTLARLAQRGRRQTSPRERHDERFWRRAGSREGRPLHDGFRRGSQRRRRGAESSFPTSENSEASPCEASTTSLGIQSLVRRSRNRLLTRLRQKCIETGGRPASAAPATGRADSPSKKWSLREHFQKQIQIQTPNNAADNTGLRLSARMAGIAQRRIREMPSTSRKGTTGSARGN